MAVPHLGQVFISNIIQMYRTRGAASKCRIEHDEDVRRRQKTSWAALLIALKNKDNHKD